MSTNEKKISIAELFFLFMKIGIITIGGGYVMIPLLQEEFVDKRNLIDIEDFLNVMAVAQSGPGGVAINASVVVGYKIKGSAGAILAAVGTILPSFAAIIVLSVYLLERRDTEAIEKFMNGARPAVVGLLIVAAYSLGREAVTDLKGLILALGGIIALLIFNVHPIVIIIAAGILGYFLYRHCGEDEN